MNLPPGLRQRVKTHLAVCRKSIVRRLVAATELRSWTTADSGSLCRVFVGSSMDQAIWPGRFPDTTFLTQRAAESKPVRDFLDGSDWHDGRAAGTALVRSSA